MSSLYPQWSIFYLLTLFSKIKFYDVVLRSTDLNNLSLLLYFEMQVCFLLISLGVETEMD